MDVWERDWSIVEWNYNKGLSERVRSHVQRIYREPRDKDTWKSDNQKIKIMKHGSSRKKNKHLSKWKATGRLCPGQSNLALDVMVGNSACGRGFGSWWSLRSLLIEVVLWFYEHKHGEGDFCQLRARKELWVGESFCKNSECLFLLTQVSVSLSVMCVENILPPMNI